MLVVSWLPLVVESSNTQYVASQDTILSAINSSHEPAAAARKALGGAFPSASFAEKVCNLKLCMVRKATHAE